jgi:acyl carrier protein
LAQRIRQLPPNEQRRELVELVCTHAAAVLGHSDAHTLDAERAFQDLGFDSLTGVELRKRLKSDTGLALSRTLIFDYPTPTALADRLRRQLLHGGDEESEDDKIWSLLRKIPLHELRRTGLLDTLLLLAGESEKPLTDLTINDEIIDSLSPDALVAMALNPDPNDDDENE